MPSILRLLKVPAGIAFNTISPKKHLDQGCVAPNRCIEIGIYMASIPSMSAKSSPIEALHPILTRKEARCSKTRLASASDSSGRLCMPRTNSANDEPSKSIAAPAPHGEVAANTNSHQVAPADDNVLARAQAGDHHAFAQLYSVHKRRIYSLCLRMVGNTAEAEDLTQEAFLQLHRKIATFRGDSAFSTWLHRLAINVVLMHLRKKGLPQVSLDEAMEPVHDDGPGRSFGAPDLSLSGSIDRLALERAVAELPAGYRLIFVLHDVEGYEHNEIAGMLDCSIGNSKSQLHKARLKLREALRTTLQQEGAR
jgi:RNA polymerase sigma-70 factor, ECF subfamily